MRGGVRRKPASLAAPRSAAVPLWRHRSKCPLTYRHSSWRHPWQSGCSPQRNFSPLPSDAVCANRHADAPGWMFRFAHIPVDFLTLSKDGTKGCLKSRIFVKKIKDRLGKAPVRFDQGPCEITLAKEIMFILHHLSSSSSFHVKFHRKRCFVPDLLRCSHQ